LFPDFFLLGGAQAFQRLGLSDGSRDRTLGEMDTTRLMRLTVRGVNRRSDTVSSGSPDPVIVLGHDQSAVSGSTL